jgi:peptidoglycan-N-acetylglucosamine deacetylase
MAEFRYGPKAAQAAVSLTYDDALVGHALEVAPALAAAGLRGTFYIQPQPRFFEQIDHWRRVAAAGHELGNHTLFHPCRKEPPERFGWMADDFDLSRYSPKRWREEIRIANELLRLVDGRAERTFGNTCCNTHLGNGEGLTELAPLILEQCVAGRGPCNGRIVLPHEANLGALGHFNGDGRRFEGLREVIEEACACGGWVILMFHGVGDAEHRLHVEPEEHRRLVEYLSAEAGRVRTAPVVEVAREIARKQSQGL